MNNIVKFLFVLIFIFGFINLSNANGNNPKAYNSSASQVASPEVVREALNKKYTSLKNKYCSDYRKSGDGVTAWCSGNYHLTKVDLAKTNNPDSEWGPYLPKNLRNLSFTPTQVRDCIKKKYSFDLSYKYSDYWASGNGIGLWTSGQPSMKLSKNELTNCTQNVVEKCGIDLYKNNNSCTQVGNGYYSPDKDDTKYACTTKPSDSEYTSDGNGTNSCEWTCNSGFHKSGNYCIADEQPVEIIIGSDIDVEDARSLAFGFDKTIDISYNNLKSGATFTISHNAPYPYYYYDRVSFTIDSSGVISYVGDVEMSNKYIDLTVTVTNPGETPVSKTFQVIILNND